MSVDTLIAKAKKEKTYFTAAQITELKKILAHNDSVPRPKRVSGEAAAEFFGMAEDTFRKAVKLVLGRSFGGSK